MFDQKKLDRINFLAKKNKEEGLTKQELLLIVVGGVFLMETLSVIIQVVSFKTRGKRVFKMAPIHHHFEMLGWSEQQVTISFWFIGFICGIIAIVIGVM